MPGRTDRGRLAVYALLALLAASMLFPFYWMAISSLKGKADVFSHRSQDASGKGNWPSRWWPIPAGSSIPKRETTPSCWPGSTRAGAESGPQGFSRFFLNTVFFALAITLGQVITSSLAAFAFARLYFPGRNQLFFAYLATLMIPATVTMIPSYILLRELGWVDTYQAVILPAVFTAYGTFMLRQFFLTIPREIEDAARIDGCSPLGLYWRIALPLSTPALATLAIVSFVGSWRSFMWPLIVTSSDDLFNLPLGLTLFRGMYTDPGLAPADGGVHGHDPPHDRGLHCGSALLRGGHPPGRREGVVISRTPGCPAAREQPGPGLCPELTTDSETMPASNHKERDQWLKRQRELKRIYSQCLGILPERCNLQVEIGQEVAMDDFEAQWVRFSSEADERVPGLLVKPASAKGRLPVILVLPGGHRTKDLAIFGHEQWPLPFAIESPHHRFPVEKLGNYEPLPLKRLLSQGFALMSIDLRVFGARAGPRPDSAVDRAAFTAASHAESHQSDAPSCH